MKKTQYETKKPHESEACFSSLLNLLELRKFDFRVHGNVVGIWKVVVGDDVLRELHVAVLRDGNHRDVIARLHDVCLASADYLVLASRHLSVFNLGRRSFDRSLDLRLNLLRLYGRLLSHLAPNEIPNHAKQQDA